VYFTTSDASKDAASDECIAFARNAAQECVEWHHLCQLPTLIPLPRMVIDVFDFDISKDVRLYQLKNKHSEYVIISHSWGAEHTLESTKSNLKQMGQGITL